MNQRCSGDGDNLDRSTSNSPTQDNASGSISLPTLELLLKRSHAEEEEGKVEDRHILRQSGPSTFSRNICFAKLAIHLRINEFAAKASKRILKELKDLQLVVVLGHIVSKWGYVMGCLVVALAAFFCLHRIVNSL
ncbi:hypothetical protein O6H91_02G156600 [Diphasiastrum complanatum]|uniref:Uncharacterized protein n=1 Tax=Diphasiastrum complanatum TaxID=34168 RepID=A0ACC2EM75_DIPCM|nr:hypothetical protein O6H91_Y346800 [Diphasiastrum complanatum]KAJ7567627.1 hypothetical protein O6H91_02G156600 [Diphasiastrum complanatum]